MIKEALQYIASLANTKIENVDGQEFSTQPLHLIKQATPECLNVRNLSGFVDYLKSNFDGPVELMIQVTSPTEVRAFTSFNRDFERNVLIHANALLPDFDFGHWYDTESFNIKLQSVFVSNEDRDIMLKVVGNIKEEQVRSTGDDGVSQLVTAKSGVATVGDVKVPNPVKLAPYRTFVEIEQPSSDFVFRMKDGPRCALFEADGGAWKLQAMQNIKNYLQKELDGELEAGNLFIIA